MLSVASSNISSLSMTSRAALLRQIPFSIVIRAS